MIELRRRYSGANQGEGHLIALQTDGKAYIELPMSIAEFGDRHPKLVIKIGSDAPRLYLDDSIVNALIVGKRSDGYVQSAFYGKSPNGNGTILCVSRTQTLTDVDIQFNKAETYIIRNRQGNYDVFIREYGTSDVFMSRNLFNFAFEIDVTTMQIFSSGTDISLYSLVLDDMNFIPWFNGTEYGLMETISGEFYGNANTEGAFIPIFEE